MYKIACFCFFFKKKKKHPSFSICITTSLTYYINLPCSLPDILLIKLTNVKWSPRNCAGDPLFSHTISTVQCTLCCTGFLRRDGVQQKSSYNLVPKFNLDFPLFGYLTEHAFFFTLFIDSMVHRRCKVVKREEQLRC